MRPEKFLIISVGHTAAGKTTLLKFLRTHFDAIYISESEIKRSLVSSYSSSDSLDEELRDGAYKIAVEKAVSLLQINNTVLLDASFHKLFRRNWVYDEITKIKDAIVIIWLNVFCDDISKVKERIKNREECEQKTYENQADKYYIFEHISNTFDKVEILSFPNSCPTVLFTINTNINKITFVSSNYFDCNIVPQSISGLYKIIHEYLKTNYLHG